MLSVAFHAAVLAAGRARPGLPGGGSGERLTVRVTSAMPVPTTPSQAIPVASPNASRPVPPKPAEPKPAPDPGIRLAAEPAEAAEAAPDAPAGVAAGGAYYFKSSEVDASAAPIEPVEPAFAKNTEFMEGFVVAEVFVNERGEVDDVTLLIADPPEVFDAAIVEALKSTRFKPAMKAGFPVKTAAVWYTKIEPVLPALAVPIAAGPAGGTLPGQILLPGVQVLSPRVVD